MPPIRVTRTSGIDGRACWGSSMGGAVVTRSSSMMRGLVSATRAAPMTRGERLGEMLPGAMPRADTVAATDRALGTRVTRAFGRVRRVDEVGLGQDVRILPGLRRVRRLQAGHAGLRLGHDRAGGHRAAQPDH